MTESHPPRRSWFAVWRWKWWVLCVVALLIAYPLSSGPMYYLYLGGYLPPSSKATLRTVYSPLEAIMAATQPTKTVYKSYTGWWVKFAKK